MTSPRSQQTNAPKAPFHLKGAIFLGYLEYCRNHVPGGLPAVWAAMREPETKSFFDQRFVVGGLYDMFPLVALARAAALVSGVPHNELVRRAARHQAERDINGVYRLMLRLVSPERVMNALPGAARQYFDFVRCEVREHEPRRWTISVWGVPRVCLVLYQCSTEIFVQRALELAGGKNVRYRWGPPEVDGEVAGYETLKLQREIQWDL